jgi:hypothetical protein
MEINEETTMKRKDYVFIGLYVLLLGGWISTVIERVEQEKEQFTKINNLNNDLIKISSYIIKNEKLISHLDGVIHDNSLMLEDVSERLQEQQKLNSKFYEMYFSTQPQRVQKEKELVEEIKEKGNQDKSATPIPLPLIIEQEAVEIPIEVPVVKRPPIASCPTLHTNLLPYIKRITLRKDYKFVANYDVADNKIINLSFTEKLPSKLQTAIAKYLNSFKMKGDIQGCYLPIKILGE